MMDISSKYNNFYQTRRKLTNYIVIHHAAFNYQNGKAVQQIYDYHRHKWVDYGRIGYHVVLQKDTDGIVRSYQVNPFDLFSASVYARNHEIFSICCALNITGLLPADYYAELRALLIDVVIPKYPNAKIVGHKEIAVPGWFTNCPGTNWPIWKTRLLRDIGK